MSQFHKSETPDSVVAAMWMIRAILEDMQGQGEHEILGRPWVSMDIGYQGNPTDEGKTQRYVKFALVFRDDLCQQHIVCATGMVYRNGEDEWHRGEFSLALSGATLPKEYTCKLVFGGGYEVREGTLKAS